MSETSRAIALRSSDDNQREDHPSAIELCSGLFEGQVWASMRMKGPHGYKHIKCPHCGEKIKVAFQTRHRMRIEAEAG